MRIRSPLLAAALAAAFPLFAISGAHAAATPPEPAQKPWLDRTLSPDQRAQLAVKAMTQEEKLRWVMSWFGNDFGKGKKIPEALVQSAGYVPGTPRLGLPALFETDAGLGVASQAGPNVRERTSLPSGLATASTWDPKVAYAGGAMIGSEARASGFNVMLAGGVNLMREPRNGRNFEYAGEDPLLAGSMVGNAIKGIESNNIISTLKHYALNDQETGRNELDARIDKAAFRMSDLLAMQLAFEQSDAGSVMCSYNRVNGPYACEHDYLLNGVLKRDWGFKGFVMSDWGATHSTVAAANNGLDQQSGHEFDKSPYFGGALLEAVKTGAVSQARLDDMVTRILRTMFAKGVVDNPVKEGGAIDVAKNGAVSRATAEEGMVLLKNDNRVLPLAKTVRTIAVIGGHADAGVLAGGGSSLVYPVGGNAVKGLLPASWPGPVMYHNSSPLRAIGAQAPDAKVVFDDGTDPARAARVAAQADVALVFATQWVGEALDATSLALPERQDELIAQVAGSNARTVVVLENGGPVAMPWLAKVPAVLEAWYPGSSGGEAIANVLFGNVNPSGHLPSVRAAAPASTPGRRSEAARDAVRRRLHGRGGGRLQMVRPEGPQAAVRLWPRPVLHQLLVFGSLQPNEGWPPARALQGDQYRQRRRQGRAAGVRGAAGHEVGSAEAPGRLGQGRAAAGRIEGGRGDGGTAPARDVRRSLAHLAHRQGQGQGDAGRGCRRGPRRQRDRRPAGSDARRARPRPGRPLIRPPILHQEPT